MGLFGKKDSNLQENKLRELEAVIALKRRERDQLKHEAVRLVTEAERRVESAKKEELALRSLRAEVSKRMALSEKKDKHLHGLERELAGRERTLSRENARLQALKAEEEKLRKELAAVERALDEKQAALSERQKAVMTLTKDVSVLAHKRAELQRIESAIEQLSAKERDLREKVARMERRVSEGERILVKQRADSERAEKKMQAMRSAVEQIAPLKKRIDSEIADRQKKILMAERELSDMEEAVKSVMVTKEQLQKKSSFLSQRERQLTEMELRVDQKIRELERKKTEIEGAEKTKQELTALVEEKRKILADLRTAIAQNSSTIQEMHEREKAARKAERDMAVQHRDADKKLKVLESKEGDLIAREAAFVEHDKSLKDAAHMLGMQKKEFLDEVNSRKAEFLLIQQEWDKKFDALAQEKIELRSEKTDVRKLVEGDIMLLKDKEEELVQTIEMLEKDKQKLEDEEKSLIRRIRELEHAKAQFERERSHLETKEKHIVDGERVVQKGMKYVETEKRRIDQDKDIVYRARELKKILPKLEKRYEELQHVIKRLEARAMDIGTRPSMSKLLKERERTIAEREKGIHREVERLMDEEHEVEALEGRKERAFSEYLREEVERVKQGKPGREVMNPEIHAMLDDAREKVMQGSLDAAVRLVAEAEYLIGKMHDENEKRVLMYDVKDLKTSIKLATLT